MTGEECIQTEQRPTEFPIPLREGQLFSYDVHISKVTNGFVIKVGCKTFVSQDWIKVVRALGEFWENPEEAQKKYCK